ncbi:rhodanese-like domain-containing protein, partial [Bacteroidota bacterium]
DLDDMLNGYIVAASDVNGNEANYYIMDLRSQTHFEAGHITGAVRTTLPTIVADAASATKPILVVCYTGQSAGHGVLALRLSGYADAKVLKWGMSGWHIDFDSWTAKIGDDAIGDPNWVMTACGNPTGYGDPTISSTATDGATILAERVAALVSGGFKGVDHGDVLATPANYYINNYWAEADVTTYGHIAGAFRIFEFTLANGEYNKLNPSATVVTYCWTGQTSSMVTAYLTVLGYNAKSLKFGVNSMIHSNLTGHNWTSSPSYPYVTGP